MIAFLITALILALGLPPLVNLLYQEAWIPQMPSFVFQTTWVVATFTTILFVYLYRSDKGSFFVQLYLLSMVVKLIGYLAYSLLIILEDRQGAPANVVYFLLVYFLFTAIEIGFLHRKFSSPSRP